MTEKIDGRMVQHMLANLGQKSMVLSIPVTQMHPSTINPNCKTEIWTGAGWADCGNTDIVCPRCEHFINTGE